MILAPSPSTSTPVPATSSSSTVSSGKENTAQAVTFICLSVAVFCACCAALILGIWFIWRRSRRDYEAFAQRQAERLAAAQAAGEGAPVKKQVRLPVVVVEPDGGIEYGRAESRFFPKGKAESSRDDGDLAEDSLPDIPPKGAYYTEGAPGYFEVDLEVGKPTKTPACTPRASSSSFLSSSRNMLNVALALMVPRTSSTVVSQTPGSQQGRPLEDSAHQGKEASPN